MANTLLLRMPATIAEESEWLLVDEAGERTGPRQRGPLSLASTIAQRHRLVILVPSTDVMLAEPELPPGSGAKLARAVPFAMEEMVTEDIETLHFAIGRRGSNGTTAVAVVARTLMDSWRSQLAAAGLAPAAMHVDASLMPQNPGQTVLWLEGSRLSVRRASGPAVTIEVSPVEEALLAIGLLTGPDSPPDGEAAQADPPESVLLYCTSEDWARVQADFDRLHERFASLKVQLLPEGPLPWLAREFPHADAINLLQGAYIAHETHASQWQRWRTAALLAAGLLGTHVAAESLALHRANAQNTELRGRIEQIFSQAMPGEKPVDPRQQMQTRLLQIRGGSSGPQHFLKTLHSLAVASSSQPGVHVDAMSFRDGTLDLKLTAPGVGDLAQLAQHISKDGMTAELQSSNPVARGIEGRMQIREPGGRKP